MKTISKPNKKLLLVILSVVASSFTFELFMRNGCEWILYVYVIIVCVSASAYFITMRGLFTHPDETVFSYDLPEEERKRLAENHKKHYFAARPLLIVILCVVCALIVDCAYNLSQEYLIPLVTGKLLAGE